MAKQNAREMLLGIWNGISAYTVIAGLTSKAITINNSLVDVTTPDATTPSNMLASESLAGIRSFTISGQLVFEDDTGFADLQAAALASPPSDQFQITIPNFGTYTGTFFVESLEHSADLEGGVGASVSLKGSGAIVFAVV